MSHDLIKFSMTSKLKVIKGACNGNKAYVFAHGYSERSVI